MYLAIIGFAMVAVIVALLLKGKMSPIVVLITIPTIAALLAGFGISDIGKFIVDGVKTTQNNAVLFIFSITYFGIMTDVGLFDILVGKLVKKAGNNVIAITVVTAIIAIMAHLDGSTACTVLITIPSMYPIYKRMNIRPYVLLLLTASAMGVMNLLPWGGPTARAATVLGMDANDLWLKLIPIQIVGVVVTLTLAVIMGIIEKKRGAGLNAGSSDTVEPAAAAEADKKAEELKRPKLLWFNGLLTIGIIVSLVLNVVSSYVVFMMGTCIALIVNYPSLKAQDARFKAHAASALSIATTMLAAGAMVGVMEGTDMLSAMANVLISFIPEALGQYIHVIFGIFALPMGMMIGTDAYFYGIMPLIIEVGTKYGVTALNTAMTMIIGKNVALMISPLVPATFLAIGLVDVELKDHIRFSFKWLFGISLVMLLAGFLLGVIQL